MIIYPKLSGNVKDILTKYLKLINKFKSVNIDKVRDY